MQLETLACHETAQDTVSCGGVAAVQKGRLDAAGKGLGNNSTKVDKAFLHCNSKFGRECINFLWLLHVVVTSGPAEGT